MSDVDTDNTASLLSQRSKEAEMAMPAVEDFFRVVAHKVRARLVNRSSVDIPVRVAGVEVKSLGAVLEDSEYREGSIYSLLRFNPPGYARDDRAAGSAPRTHRRYDAGRGSRKKKARWVQSRRSLLWSKRLLIGCVVTW